ncbi:hypothetical protein I8748_16475 [Nostoc sp. CENA67]|uniref:Uncharacterized protein n=1 Tax=Amazonocrinis nigriterrae CENA67 TaxID=2794033 RepID=A0A8J7HQT9_9NOST|nr:hypothetical protein [Amazonocrinis nigriterrae]MBH8563767.1 hypothetical protein [Amazonocrinis nigriterrae CENA67]
MAELYVASTSGFTETATDITISKSILAFSGYTPRNAMTLEEFLLALVIKFSTIFTEAAQTADSDRQIVIDAPTSDDISLTGTSPNRYATFDYKVTLRKPAPSITFTPTDF